MEHDGLKTENQDNDKAPTIIAEFLVHTPRDKIAEVTPMPLDQHRPHSLIKMLSDVQRSMCKEAVLRQKRLNKIYAEYHKDKDGKDIIPVDLDNDDAWDVEKLEETNLEQWSYYYMQLRRGFKSEGLMSLTTLAQAQLESEPPAKAEDILKHMTADEG